MGCGTSRTVATATAEGPLPDDANGGHSGDQALNTAGSATWIPVTTENKSDGDMDPLHSVCSCHGELPAEEFVEAESWLEAMDNAGMLVGNALPDVQYNHRMMGFLRHQLDEVRKLELLSSVQPEKLKKFWTVYEKGIRLLRKHAKPFDMRSFYKIEEARTGVEEVCRLLRGMAEEWEMWNAANVKETIPEEYVEEDRRHLQALLAYILKGEGSSVSSQWEEIKSQHKEQMKFLQVIDDHELHIGQRLGAGSQGAVHRAIWKSEKVAVKKPHSGGQTTIEDFAAFTKEVTVHAKLVHPHIAQLYAMTLSGYLVMELADADLKAVCEKQGLLNWPAKLRLLLQAASALCHVHSQNPILVHSDVKSSNFLIFGSSPENFHVKITDFGLAFEKLSGRSKSIRLGGGTTEWIAPEIYHGQPLTPASDVYSFGVVIYEVTTGQHPYGANKLDQHTLQAVVMNKKLSREEPCQVGQGDCPQGLVELMRDCCAFEPSHRPTMEEVWERLQVLPEDWSPPWSPEAKEAAHTDGFSCKPQQDCPPLNYDLQVKPFSGSPRGTGRGALGPLRAGYLTDEHGKVMQVAIRYGYEGMAQKAIKFFRSALDMRQGISCHPNIVRCYGGRVNFKRGDHFGDQGICIVEELMYANLQDVLQEFDANMPLRLILKIALDVASGLEHLHRASVVKCDLKPTTIFVDEDLRTAKISAVDLSNAKGDMRPEDYAPSTFILSSDIGYMAPELFLYYMRNRKPDGKTDVYSLGVVLWQMLVGAYGPPRVAPEDRLPISKPCPAAFKQLLIDCVNPVIAHRPTATEVRQRLLEMMLADHDLQT